LSNIFPTSFRIWSHIMSGTSNSESEIVPTTSSTPVQKRTFTHEQTLWVVIRIWVNICSILIQNIYWQRIDLIYTFRYIITERTSTFRKDFDQSKSAVQPIWIKIAENFKKLYPACDFEWHHFKNKWDDLKRRYKVSVNLIEITAGSLAENGIEDVG